MNLSKRLANQLEKNKKFKESLDIVRKNSSGKIWLIGGGLSRNLSNLIYGGTKEGHDFDFIVEERKKKIILPGGWKMKRNKYGSPKFICGKISVDFIPLNTISSIKRRGLRPTIRNFLTGTPFTIQSMAYDFDRKKILGRKGLRALRKKIFKINNLEQALIYASKKGLSLDALIIKKAKSMNFDYRL